MRTPRVLIIGAGIGGLTAALRLQHLGAEVHVFDAANQIGGKMRPVLTDAGPADTGPTVLTMSEVFSALFQDVGTNLKDHITLTPLPRLARHFWRDGTTLDLFTDHDASRTEIASVFGPRSAAEFDAFSKRAARLLDGFNAPMMQSARPTVMAAGRSVLTNPGLLHDMAPRHSLFSLLKQEFSDPRLAQLFARYATYIGGLPAHSPAILSLIAAAEARGVWAVKGGMHQLALAVANLATLRGVTFHLNQPVRQLHYNGSKVTGLTADREYKADAVIHAGDPNALALGMLGDAVKGAVKKRDTSSRSLSAQVLAFAARPRGAALCYHNVFFGTSAEGEYNPLHQGRQPQDATLYVCAQDRAHGISNTPLERFEIILNAPPLPTHTEPNLCQDMILSRLSEMGLTFSEGPKMLTGPAQFAALYPGSMGSLYGQSPHGIMAAFRRPTARSRVAGLYLCGGGAHPGAGVPMAALSGRHVAEAIAQDHGLTLKWRQTDTHGGTSMGSAPMAAMASR